MIGMIPREPRWEYRSGRSLILQTLAASSRIASIGGSSRPPVRSAWAVAARITEPAHAAISAEAPPPPSEGRRSDDAAPVAVHRDEPCLGERPLGDDQLVAQRGNTDRLDVDTELGGPEHRQPQVRTAVRTGTDHVVGGDLGLFDRVAPVLQCQELVVESGWGLRATSPAA